MISRRFLQFACVAGLFLALGPGLASAGVLDQVFEPDLSDGYIDGEIENIPPHELASGQSFTVGLGGILTGVEVLLSRVSDEAGDLVVEIQTTTAGIPDGGMLGFTTVPRSEIPQEPTYLSVDLTAAGIPVAVGDQLAIVLRAVFHESDVRILD